MDPPVAALYQSIVSPAPGVAVSVTEPMPHLEPPVPAGDAGGVVQITDENRPLPCVAATKVWSDARYLIISVLTTGKLLLAVHTVEAPLIRLVSHIPVS